MGRRSKKSRDFLEVEKESAQKSLNSLRNGNASKRFQKFLKKYDLDLPRPKETGDIVQDIKNNIIWLEERRKWLDIILDYYKSGFARAQTILDDTIELDYLIMKRRKELESKGINPLEDEAYMKALDAKFKRMQYLDKMKFEKDKFEMEHKIKQMKKEEINDDKLFIVEADYDVEERFEEAEKEKKGDTNESDA